MTLMTQEAPPVSSQGASVHPPSVGARPDRAKAPTNWLRLFGLREMGVYYALLILVLVLTIASAYTGRVNYLSMQNVTNVMHQSSLTAVMAMAMTVILVTGNL